MRVAITGAAGFIGFHCAQALARQGIPVWGMDNFNDYYDPELKHARARALAEQGISVEHVDLCDARASKAWFEAAAPTHLLHLAAQAGVRYSLSNPQAYIQSNIDGFLQILELLRHAPATKLVYASSSSVYGLNSDSPFQVNDRTDHQASLYGVSKKTNELMAHSYHHLFGISCTGLRFFTVYGPWGRPDMAYFSFTQSIIQGRPIKVFNHGKMQRDFTYIDDIVAGIVAALQQCDGYHLYNLGNHQPESLATFIACIEDALGLKATKEFLPMQAGDVLATYADISDSQRDLGFLPRTRLRDGIQSFVNWYRSHYGSPSLAKC